MRLLRHRETGWEITVKNSTIALFSLGLLYGSCAADEPKSVESRSNGAVELRNDSDKVVYSLGYELGKDLSHQELELAPEVLLRGAEDGISGRAPLVSASERHAALKQIREIRAKENLEQSSAFLAANAQKQAVQTLPSGLQYKELRGGDGKSPGANDTVRVHYRGRLIDGTEFDSSYERGKPATFRVSQVIKGWQEGLQLMKEGAKWELFIPPELAYGERGRPKVIPPNSALIFEVELIAVK